MLAHRKTNTCCVSKKFCGTNKLEHIIKINTKIKQLEKCSEFSGIVKSVDQIENKKTQLH